MKPKVLFFVQVPPPIHGASLRNLSLVQSEYLNTRYDIQLLPLSFADSIADIGKLNFKKIYKLVIIAFKLIKSLLLFKPHFVYFTISPVGGAFYRDLLFVFILKIFQAKRVYHIRGMGINKAMSTSVIKNRLYNWAFQNAHVICLSNSHLEDLVQVSCKKKYVVNNGIHVSKYSIRNSFSQLTGKVRILFLSNFVISKGVIFFVDTLNELKKMNFTFEAIMIGADADITKEKLIDYISEKDMTDCISVKGKVSDEEQKFGYFKWADIFFFPTYYPNEVFPGVILEAMQSGCAILSTTTGVIPDIIENGFDGIIEIEKSPQQFANQLAKLLSEPEVIQKLGKQARISFENKYTMQVFEEKMHTVFSQIV